MVSHLDIPLMVFELGCGNTKKSQLILNEILQHQSHLDYSPNDFSKGEISECIKYDELSFKK